MPCALRRTDTFCASPLSGCTPDVGTRLCEAWLFIWQRHDDISKVFRLPNTDKVQINLTEGLGAGLLYPKTNATVLGKERHDDFHISGYGLSAKAGINFTFFKYFYIQGEVKTGYINMQDIRTTASGDDRASQDFFFFQRIIAFGGIFRL